MEKKQSKMGVILVVSLLAIFFIILIANLSSVRKPATKTVSTPFATSPLYSKKPPEKKPATPKASSLDIAKIEDAIKTAKETGLLLRINPQMNAAFVNSAIWQALDYQLKKDIGAAMAVYCGYKKGTNINWVEIKDYRSGKRLAKYSQSFGLKTY